MAAGCVTLPWVDHSLCSGPVIGPVMGTLRASRVRALTDTCPREEPARTSARGPAPVDDEHVPGDHPCGGGEEEAHGPGDVLDLGDPAERDAGEHVRAEGVVAQHR